MRKNKIEAVRMVIGLKQKLHRLYLTSIFVLLSACGGSGSGDAPDPAPAPPLQPPANKSPVVDAGPDQIAGWNSSITLTGSATDSDGTISSYRWIQTSGTSVSLSGNNSVSGSFVSPSDDSILVFELTATDNEGSEVKDTVTINVKSEFLWSEIEVWGGTIPGENDSINIPENVTVTLDVSSVVIADLTIEGELLFGPRDISLTADWILVKGKLQIGSEAEPYTNQASITLTGDSSQNIMNMGSRGLFIMSGILELHGKAPLTTWTKISNHIEAGSSAFSVLESYGWKAGDQIVLAPTDFYEVGATQLLTLNSVNNNSISTNSAVNQFHWGLIQYANTTGMSLTQGSPVTNQSSTPIELDERAEVGNLSRNIIIQSKDDSSWQNNGYGAQVMVMGLDSVIHVDGVEFRRSGQAGLLGRYPFHWHRLSYPDGITNIGDVNGHYLRNSTIHNSANRCVTIHATNGVRFENNICYDIKGHGIFFEDAVERRNIIENNLVLGIRFPSPENALSMHERIVPGAESGSSGIWITNPDNTVRNNVFADALGFGIWMAFPERALGVSSGVSMNPSQLTFGNFDNNTVHSNFTRGAMFDFVPIDDEGRVFPLQYGSTSDQTDSSCPYTGYQRFSITGWKLWKNSNNFWNRARCVNYNEFVSADGVGKFFSGAGESGLITRALIVGSSLNDLSTKPKSYIGPPAALATYHSAFDMTNNIIMNFPLVESKTSGAFATDDYYTRPVEKGMVRNIGNLLINSHGGHRSDARINENIAGNFAQGLTHFVFAGAILDSSGIWGPVANWSVYDNPFFTYNANCTPIVPISENATSCDGKYFGISQFYLDQTGDYFVPTMAISVERYDPLLPNGPAIGVWNIDKAQPGALLQGMRDFAVRPGGLYKLDFPTSATPNDVSIDLTNMLNSNDNFTMAISFEGTNQALVYTTSASYPEYLSNALANSGNSNIKHNYTELTSKQAVIDSQGETFWQDSANNLVWIKISRSTLQDNGSSSDEFSELNLYKTFRLRIW